MGDRKTRLGDETLHGVEAKIADKLADLRERDRAAKGTAAEHEDDRQR